MVINRVFKLALCVFAVFVAVFPFLATTSKAWVASGTPVSSSVFVTEDNYGQIAVDASGNVYVTGVTPSGINKYDSNGNLLLNFGPSTSAGIAITSTGDVVVTDWDAGLGTQAVYKFTSTGTPIDISSTDMGAGTFIFAYGVAADSAGNVYVSDFQGNGDADMVRKFNSAGDLVATITANGGNFDQIQAISVDGDDNLYVLDSGNGRVQKFNSAGVFQLEVTANGIAWSYPEGFTVDTAGNIYVNDSGNNRIQIFDTNGVFQQELDATDVGLVAFDYLAGVGIGETGIMYVGNYSNVVEVVFDHADPVTTITALPGNTTSDTTPTITGSTTDSQTAITAVEYSIDAGAYSACSADDLLFDELTEAYSCSVSPALSLGSHTIEVRATDSKNNVNVGATIASYTFTVSAATPTPSASSTPAPTSAPTATPTNTYCSTLPPNSAPYIFKISRTGKKVNIYFSPLTSNVTEYQLMYGYSPEDERFSVTFPAEFGSGAMKYTVDELEPSQTYSFWMRAMNGCAPGPWSNTYTSYGLKGVKPTPSSNPNASATPKPSTSPGTTPEISLVTEESTPSAVTAVITIVDPLGQPFSETPVTILPTDQSPNENTLENFETDKKGTITYTNNPGEYTISVKYGDTTYSQELVLTPDTNEVRIKVPIPLKEALKRQIYAPIDASYAVKAGVAVVALNSLAATFIGLFAASSLVLPSLVSVYTATARSFLRLPFDLIGSLGQFAMIGITTRLAPVFPSIKRKSKSNGLVFAADSFRPIPKAYVVLFSASGNLKTSFTDAHGRYNFDGLVSDDYQMRAEAPRFIFPSTILTESSTSDIDHVYQPGEILPVSQDASILKEVAVPMDPKDKPSWLSKLKSVTVRTAKKLTAPTYIVSSLAIGAAVVTNPSQFNQIVAILFGFYMLGKVNAKRQIKRMSGQLLDASRLPVVDAQVKLFRANSRGDKSMLYTTTKTDSSGRYYLQPEIANYVLEITTSDGKEISQSVRIMKNAPTIDKVIVVS